MAVSSTSTKDMTVDEIIALAMVKAGILNPAHLHSPPAPELEVGRLFLFTRLQSMPNSSVLLRAKERVTQALTANVAYVEAAADTLTVEKSIVLRDSAGNDRDLTVISEAEYQSIADKDAAGTPTQAYVEKVSATETWRIHLWPVSDGTEAYSINYPRTRRLRDVEPGSVTLDLSPKWYQYIVNDLATTYAGSKGRANREAVLKEDAGLERTIAENDETVRGDVQFVLGD